MRRFAVIPALVFAAASVFTIIHSFAETAPIGTVTVSGSGSGAVPIATPTVAGKVKVGAGLGVTTDGTLSVTAAIMPNRTTLASIGAGPTYKGQPIAPLATALRAGVVKVGSGLAVSPDGTLTNTGIAGVASFYGRGGAVMPQANDYSIGQISGAAAVAATGSWFDINNRPTFAPIATSGGWGDITGKPSFAQVASSASYLDLINKPTIPAAQVSSDWNASIGVAQILNKPTIPSALSQLSQNASYRTVTDSEKAAWNGNTAPVTSVFGRTGAVTKQAGDYTASDVGADALGSATSVQTNLNAVNLAFKNFTSNDRLTKSEAAAGYLASANYPVKNVLALGILNNGSDQGSVINALFAAASDGDSFYFPKGAYGHSTPINFGDKAIKVTGDGPHSSFFVPLAPMARNFYRAASGSVVQRAEISNIGVLCNKLSNYAFELQAWKQAKLHRIYIEDALVDGMLLGQNGTSGSANMFYEAQISEIEVYQKTGGWLPDPSLRVNKGIHLLNSASDNTISRVVVAYAKTAGIHDEAYGNNQYSQIHPWGTGTYPMQYGIIAEGRATITNSEFDTNATAGVKVGSTGHVSVSGSIFANGTPTAVEIANTAPGVAIGINTYEGVTNKYTGTPGTGFSFVDGLTYGTAAGNLVQLDGGGKVLASLIPTLNQNTTGTASGLSATLAAASGGTGTTDFAFNTSAHDKVASFTGTVGTGQCVQTDGSGNLTTTGSACGTGSGSGIIELTGDVSASGSGSVAATVVQGSTSTAGKLQLTDSVVSTSTTTAATPNSVKTAYDLAATKAPSDATYIMQTASSGTSAEQALSSLSSGFLKVTTGTGVLTSDNNTYYKSGDFSTFGRVVLSGSSLASGTSPIAVFPTVTNADVQNFGGTNQNLDASTGTYKAGFNANMNVIPTAAKSDEYYGIRVSPVVKASYGTSYNLATYKGISIQPQTDSGYAGTIANMYGIEVQNGNKNGGGATYTNQYGLKIQDQTSGGTNYALYTGTGLVRFGDAVSTTSTITGGTYIISGHEEKTASYTVSKDSSRITLASGTAVATLLKTLPAGEMSVLVTVAGAAASGVSIAAESGGSVSFGDAGAPAFINNKTSDVVCISQNASTTTTAAWRCTKGGDF